MTREVKHGVQQHRRMTIREHESIAIDPARIGRIEVHDVAPEDLGDIGHPHRCTRMTRGGALHRIHGEGANGVREEAALRHGKTRVVYRKPQLSITRARFFNEKGPLRGC